jgi:hypothetical protein
LSLRHAEDVEIGVNMLLAEPQVRRNLAAWKPGEIFRGLFGERLIGVAHILAWGQNIAGQWVNIRSTRIEGANLEARC